MNASRLLLGLLILAGLAGTLLLLRPDPAEEVDGIAPPTGGIATPGESAAADLNTPGSALAPGTDSPTEGRTALGADPVAGAATRTVRVAVAFPAGAPAEPDLEVVAVAEAVIDGDEPDELLARFASEGEPAGSMFRARVAGDGVAELVLPESLADVRLLVDGSYLFSRELRALGGDETQVTLDAHLGGVVTVRLLPPAGASPTGELSLTGGDWSGGSRAWHNRDLPVTADAIHFRGVDPDLTWTVSASFDAHHADMRMGIEAIPGGDVEVELPVVLGARVGGVVVDEEGRPLAGVEVSAGGGMPWMGGADARTAETAMDGTFALAGIAPGTTRVEAEREGWLDAESDELTLADGDEITGLRLVMSRGLSIAGVVLDGDGPVAEAQVRVERLERQNWGGWGGGSRVRRAGRGTTGEDGRFSISGIEEGTYTVRASRTDEAAELTSRAVLEGVDAGGPEVTLTLEEPVSFAGRVVDDRDEPVVAFRLEVESVEQGGPEEAQDFEDEEGSFRFGRVGPGEWEVRVEAEGYIQVETVEHTLPDAGDELVLRMARTARVAGIVLGTNGAPVAGADVRGDDGSGDGGWGGGWGGPRGPRAETDAEGRFVLEEITPGALSVTAQAEGWADSPAADFELVPGDVREEVVLTLRVGGRIEGQVLTPEGDPIAARRVTWGSNSMGFGSRGDTTSDADGRFVFDHVTPGEWAVSAVPSFEEFGSMGGGQSSFAEVMGKMITKTVAVADGERVEVFLGGVPRQPVRVFGTVSRAGVALGGAEVYAVSETSAVFEGMKAATAADDGTYEIILDRPGPHTISANSGDVGVEEVVEIPRTDELRLDLTIPLGRIEGRVVEPDGSPAAGTRLSLQREDGLGRIRWAGGQKTTDAEGRYAFEDLQEGVYTVRANVATWGGGANDRFGASAVDGIVVGRDETVRGVDFELATAGTVTGQVVGSDGAPVRGASLYFRDATGRLVTPVSSTLTDAAGRFEKTGLAPGEYTVSARTETLAAGDEARVRVLSDQTSEVRVVAETGVMVLVTLEDPDGQARRSRVQVLDADGRDVAGLITMETMRAAFNEGSSTMQQRVGPIPPGRYTVRAVLEDGTSDERKVRLRSKDTEKTVVLKLD